MQTLEDNRRLQEENKSRPKPKMVGSFEELFRRR
jgi:hypothetical protein